MLKQVILGTIIMGAVAVTGCTSKKTERLETLSTQVQVIDKKVDDLQTKVDAMKQDVLIVRGDAARANQRLDNLSTSYRK